VQVNEAWSVKNRKEKKLSNIINWYEFMDTYNNIKNTNYTDPKKWISDLYNKHNNFVNPLAEELGVGHITIRRYLIDWGFFVKKPKGGARVYDRTGKVEKRVLAIPHKTLKELSRRQIAERCSGCLSSVSRILKKHNLECRKITSGRKPNNEWQTN
jgi:hypothetical protein